MIARALARPSKFALKATMRFGELSTMKAGLPTRLPDSFTSGLAQTLRTGSFMLTRFAHLPSLSIILIAAIVITGCAGIGQGPAAPSPQQQQAGIEVVNHIILMYQENRSFDHYSGTSTTIGRPWACRPMWTLPPRPPPMRPGTGADPSRVSTSMTNVTNR